MEEHMNASSYVVLSKIYELLSHMHASSVRDIPEKSRRGHQITPAETISEI